MSTPDLRRAAFQGIAFPVSKAPFEVGNDLVEHTADQVPGVDLEPTGRTAFRGSMEIPFLTTIQGYGELYPTAWRRLLDALQSSPKGDLTHPVLGTFRAGLKVLKSPFESKVRNGVIVELEWIEDRASLRTLVTDPTPTATPGEAVATADRADAALVAAGASPRVAAPVRLAASKLSTPQTFAATVATFDALDGAIASALSLPALASSTSSTALSRHAAVAHLEELRATCLHWRALALPGRARVFVAPRAMATWEVAAEVYGDVGRAATIRSANGLTTAVVRAGARLVIPP